MTDYYQANAYRSDDIPAQPYPQQNWDSLLRTHLPWGHTEDVYYDYYYPQALRNEEKLFQDIASGKDKNPIDYSKFHFRYDHEVFRYAKAAWVTQALFFFENVWNGWLLGMCCYEYTNADNIVFCIR